ncbi:phosphate ABC transporter permease PstA [Natronorubrum thiooxidans]|uniref:Phosphate transport system permease protein PstA n=1 Tax=Natronorubrum thiooxidans TaxID=308853 RepID=A0A1N7CM28_9EURY|nr:phosphate ABC transporter permease PstA [Natronorubrum thiooxidans]SIR64666.1 phosphate ABC transporter membrane protein 2, PhoT family [Natronorubrum thiooxidans]
MTTADESSGSWFGADGKVSQRRGLLFKLSCLGATLLALLLVLVFLLYVANDAIQPFTADSGWLATVAATVVLPALALAAYYYRDSEPSGSVAYISFGLPIAATLLAGGVVIVFRHVISPHGWLALAIAGVVAAAVLEAHARTRTGSALERLAVVVVVPWFALIGIPGFSVDYTVTTPFLGQELFDLTMSVPTLIPSLRGLIVSLPILPTAALSLLASFTLPIAAVAAMHVRRVRESDRAGVIGGVATFVAAGAGMVAAPIAGVAPETGVIAATVIGMPVGLYVESVQRRGEGMAGLAFPVVIGGGAVLAAVLVNALGFAGPELWLDWQFLNSSHSTTPADAGIYPALVGSVMMLTVVAISAFPIGVGAAVYLEEYAPNQGRPGQLVEFLEINIANLAGVPSVVYGVLGLALFVRTAGLQSGIVVVGGFTIALLILPIIIVSAQEAIRGVPDSLRQASYGMGATKWQTVRSVVLPRAMPGILTGTILALGRAIGETAPLLMVGVAAVVRIPPNSFFGLFSAMPRQIYSWSRLIATDFRYGVLAAGVLTLLIVMLMMNASAIVLRNKYQRNS